MTNQWSRVEVFGGWSYDRVKYQELKRVLRKPLAAGAAYTAEALRQYLADYHISVDARLHEDSCGRAYRLQLREYDCHDPLDVRSSKAWRIDKFEDPSEPDSEPPVKWNRPSSPDCVVIHVSENDHIPKKDRGSGDENGFSTSPDESESLADLRHSLFTRNPKSKVFVIAHSLPVVHDGGKEIVAESTLWKMLAHKEVRERVTIVTSSNDLRRGHSFTSRWLSWEQSVEDLCADFQTLPAMRFLAQFTDIVIRFGHDAALHWDNGWQPHGPRFIFAPMTKDGRFRNATNEGRVVGKNVLFTAALINEFMRHPDWDPQNWEDDARRTKIFENGLRRAINASMRMFTRGYLSPYDADGILRRTPATPEEILRDHFGPGAEILRTSHPQIQGDGGLPKHASGSILEKMERHDAFRLVAVSVPTRITKSLPGSRPIRRTDWEIVREGMNLDPLPLRPSGAGELPHPPLRINIAMAVAMYGHRAVLNRELPGPKKGESLEKYPLMKLLVAPACKFAREEVPDHLTLPQGQLPIMPLQGYQPIEPPCTFAGPICAPIGEYGRFVTVERREIEAFGSIRNLLRQHVEDAAEKRSDSSPMSIGVFGPPGSGKSFAVKELASTIRAREIEIRPLAFNVSQCRDVLDFEKMLRRFRDEFPKTASGSPVDAHHAREPVPLVFIDEFDSDYRGRKLGWLKYFLAPMQDGTFHGTEGTTHFGPTIFVFAGGTAKRFVEFDPSDLVDTEANRLSPREIAKLVSEFKQRKGPDFVSRLRGHINIEPIDMPAGKTKLLLRRAFLVRSLLQKWNLISPQEDGAGGQVDRSNLDPDLAYALLTVDRYRHGARSIEALLRMCGKRDDSYAPSALPTRAQVDMHVDADEFFIRMHRGRYRRLAASSRQPQSLASAARGGTGASPQENANRSSDEVPGKIAPTPKAAKKGNQKRPPHGSPASQKE